MPDSIVKRVLLIGWDAADWSYLTPLLDAGKMPNLQRVIETGTSGRIATLQPVLSPILWTSIATGKRGDQHGILSFVEPRPDGQGIRPVTSTSRRAKALWNILSQNGRPSVVVNWFASHPAETVNGAIVSNRFSQAAGAPGWPEIEENAFHPRDLAPTMDKLRLNSAKLAPAQLAPFFLEKFPADDDPRLESLARLLAQCASVHNAATYLAEAEDWDFLAVYYDTIDHAGHGFAEFDAPRLPHVSEEDFKTYRYVMESMYRYHDLMLGRWLELAGEETTVIVLSDHGFYHGEARPLAERGHLSGERPAGVATNPLVWHRLHGVFAACGPGIKRDALVHGSTLLDVAPTVLALLGVPVPADFEGEVLTQIFDTPPATETIPTWEPPHPEDGVHRGVATEDEDPWAAQQALAQLVELGYLQAPSDDVAKTLQEAEEAHQSHLAQILFSTGRFTEAREILAELAQGSTDYSFRCREAMCLLALGRRDEAQTIVDEVLTKAPHYALAKMLRGQAALTGGDHATAERIFAELAEAEAEMPALHNQLGAIYLRQRRWTEAAALFRRALEADPDFAEAHDGLGVALRHLGDVDEAVHQHMCAVSLQHDRAQTHINLGLSLVRAKQVDWAVRAFTVASELAPAEPFPHRCLAQIYRRIRPDRAKAREHLLRARDLRRSMRRGKPRQPAFRQGV